MSAVRATDEWSFRGYKAVILENEHIRVSVFPEIGSKIYDIIHVPSGTNVLWHNPRIPLQKAPFGSRFDDVWAGGWDEVFPNDQESVVGGEKYPDMGEVWSLPWEYELEEQRNSASVTTRVVTPISPSEITRRVTLENGSSSIRCDYEIKNLSGDQMKFLWKIHAAFEINDRCSLDVPAKRALVDPRFQQSFRRFILRLADRHPEGSGPERHEPGKDERQRLHLPVPHRARRGLRHVQGRASRRGVARSLFRKRSSTTSGSSSTTGVGGIITSQP